MATFRYKPDKIKYLNNINTLDETHRKLTNEFEKKRNNIEKKKSEVTKFKNQLKKLEDKNKEDYTDDDTKKKSKLKNDIVRLTNEIQDIENNTTELDYYSKTDSILMDYYDIIEKNLEETMSVISNSSATITEFEPTEKSSDVSNKLEELNLLSQKKRKPKKPTRKRARRLELKVGPSIIDLLNNPHKVQEQQEQQKLLEQQELDAKKQTRKEKLEQDRKDELEQEQRLMEENDKPKKTVTFGASNRASLFDSYMTMIDRSYNSGKKSRYNPIKICQTCDIEKCLVQAEGMYVCTQCGEVESVIIESEVPNYKDSATEKPLYPYKRSKVIFASALNTKVLLNNPSNSRKLQFIWTILSQYL
ncbi:MAG: late transcription factor VLTF3-like protein [Edafosvirus sp.]|uniref:Late transcription factor VLTF3-like protein n=1 Tax=Edafosvirus sp. TaxID=2487765 RepID=A0A3G4ZUM8_9VIRU|nr:MAG: late transcription factor VLTF3-like protein [Edafosvirus sp.]